MLSVKLEEGKKNAELSSSYINIGLVYNEMRNYQEAEKYFIKALTAYSSIPEITTLYGYMNLAELYQQTKNFERNLSLTDTIYELAIATNTPQGIGAAFNYKANSLYEFERYKEALTNIDSALIYFPKEAPQRYRVLLDKTKILLQLKKYEQAETILLELLPAVENIWDKKVSVLLFLSEIYKNKKQFEKSLEYFEKYKVAEDTLTNREQQKEVANLLIEYETEEKEKAIDKLNQEAKIKDLELRNSYFITIGSIVLGFIILVAVWIFFRQKNIIDTFKKTASKTALEKSTAQSTFLLQCSFSYSNACL